MRKLRLILHSALYTGELVPHGPPDSNKENKW
jgi:hypothetical protein